MLDKVYLLARTLSGSVQTMPARTPPSGDDCHQWAQTTPICLHFFPPVLTPVSSFLWIESETGGPRVGGIQIRSTLRSLTAPREITHARDVCRVPRASTVPLSGSVHLGRPSPRTKALSRRHSPNLTASGHYSLARTLVLSLSISPWAPAAAKRTDDLWWTDRETELCCIAETGLLVVLRTVLHGQPTSANRRYTLTASALWSSTRYFWPFGGHLDSPRPPALPRCVVVVSFTHSPQPSHTSWARAIQEQFSITSKRQGYQEESLPLLAKKFFPLPLRLKASCIGTRSAFLNISLW